jgi:hypothetical protein
MRKVYIGILALVVVIGFGAAVALAQGHVTLSLAPQGLSDRSPVEFEHQSHLKALGDDSCKECHHGRHGGKVSYESGDEEKSCSECHKVEANGNMPSLMRAFHKNCEGCHAKLRASYKESGPVSCGGCHKKK